MRGKKKTLKREKSAMTVSMYGNLLFVIIELVMAVYTSSQAVLLDAVYDGIEFFMLLPSVLMIPLLYKPSSEKRPFGYMQVETIFLVVKGITMTAVTLGLIVNNLDLLLHGGRRISFDTVAYFELFACVLSLGVVVYLKRKNRSLNSPLIETEMQGWKIDCVVSLGVAYFELFACVLSLGVVVYLKRKNRSLNSPLIETEMQGWKIDCVVSLGMAAAFFLPRMLPDGPWQVLTPYLDQIITIVLSMFMLPAPIRMVISGLRDLLLLPPDQETVQNIHQIVEQSLQGTNYSQIQHEIVKTGRKLWISTYITLEKDEVSLLKFQQAQSRCIEALREEYTDFYFELLPLIEFQQEQLSTV